MCEDSDPVVVIVNMEFIVNEHALKTIDSELNLIASSGYA